LLNSGGTIVEVNDGHRRSAERFLRQPCILRRTLGRLEGSGSNQPTYQPIKQPSNKPSSQATNLPTRFGSFGFWWSRITFGTFFHLAYSWL